MIEGKSNADQKAAGKGKRGGGGVRGAVDPEEDLLVVCGGHMKSSLTVNSEVRLLQKSLYAEGAL